MIRNHLMTSQESLTMTFPTASVADELLSHVLECGALGGRCASIHKGRRDRLSLCSCSGVSMVAVGRCGVARVEVSSGCIHELLALTSCRERR